MPKKIIFLLFLFLTTHPSWSDDSTKTFEDKIPSKLLDNNDKFITFTFENDTFAGTDANYTNGVRMTYFDTGTKVPDFVFNFFDLIPVIEINDTTSVYYSLGHNLYTPEVISSRVPDYSDRPYAAFLYGTIGMITTSGDHQNNLELSLGLVGPSALGEPVQETVHDLVGATDPSGWDSQLRDEPAFILSYQRVWPEFFAAEMGSLYFRTSPHMGVSFGNIYTYAATGIGFQLMPKKYKWQAPPLRVRPSIPGSGYFSVPDKKFAWSIFAGFEGRAMGRNIFLDGNSYQDSASVSKKTFVGDANLGLSLTYGRVQTSFTLNWRSKEFDGGGPANFGVLSLGYRL